MIQFFKEMLGTLKDIWDDHWSTKLIMSLIAAILVFAGYDLYCQYDALSLKTGTVISKNHSDARDDLTVIYIDNTPYQQWTHWPESWSVTIEGRDPNGVHKKRTVSVGRDQWDQISEGETRTFE